MKEISLKRPAEKVGKGSTPELAPKDSYPSFSVYDKAPDELMKCPMGCEMTAKVKLTSKDVHEGPNGRKSVGFDILSITVNDKNEKVEAARAKGKEIAESIKGM
jgi:hypothetical protein